MGIGVPELVLILLIVVVLFGANRLPQLGAGVGKAIRNFKDATNEGAKDKSDT
jgi:sec-independent protein translocase protein TatA